MVGLLAGLVPCIDALALFVFAIGIGNVWYSFLIIIAFSIGLGLMLAKLSNGILYIFLEKFSSQNWTKFCQ